MSLSTINDHVRRSRKKPLALGALAIVTLTGVMVHGATPKSRQDQTTAAALPLQEAAIHARITGYLQSSLVDIGDTVETGQTLAMIATPELDAQVEKARATLLEWRANLRRDQAKETLAVADLNRARRLWQKRVISAQQHETASAQVTMAAAAVEAAAATIKANEAEIHRLEAHQSFQRVTAPFSGVISAKNADVGALVSADSPNSSKELFHVMRIDTRRVLVNLPEADATLLTVGEEVVVHRAGEPRQTVQGKVARAAIVFDPTTQTLLTEVRVPNPGNRLRPGMSLQIRFARPVEPATAISHPTGRPGPGAGG